ncbi:MAG: hypothetical protein ACLSGB_14635 [Dorea sp.]
MFTMAKHLLPARYPCSHMHLRLCSITYWNLVVAFIMERIEKKMNYYR